jgi:hypothetical protein
VALEVVERVHVGEAALLDQLARIRIGVVPPVAVQHDLGAIGARGADLRRRRVRPRPTLRIASPDELVEVFDAFKVTVVFDKANHKLTLAATITPELVPQNEKTPTATGPVGEFVHSGGAIRTRDL